MSIDLEVLTDHQDVSDLVSDLAGMATEDSLRLPVREPIAEGEWVRFNVRLEDGTPVLAGVGRCESPSDAHASLALLSFDARNEVMFERILLARDTVSAEATGAFDLSQIAGPPPPPGPLAPQKPAGLPSLSRAKRRTGAAPPLPGQLVRPAEIKHAAPEVSRALSVPPLDERRGPRAPVAPPNGRASAHPARPSRPPVPSRPPPRPSALPPSTRSAPPPPRSARPPPSAAPGASSPPASRADAEAELRRADAARAAAERRRRAEHERAEGKRLADERSGDRAAAARRDDLERDRQVGLDHARREHAARQLREREKAAMDRSASATEQALNVQGRARGAQRVAGQVQADAGRRANEPGYEPEAPRQRSDGPAASLRTVAGGAVAPSSPPGPPANWKAGSPPNPAFDEDAGTNERRADRAGRAMVDPAVAFAAAGTLSGTPNDTMVHVSPGTTREVPLDLVVPAVVVAQARATGQRLSPTVLRRGRGETVEEAVLRAALNVGLAALTALADDDDDG